MRVIAISAFLMIMISPSFVFAFDDGFGERFYNNAPSSLGEHEAPIEEIPDIAMDEMAEQLQNILPAAGEEESNDLTPIPVEE